MDDRTLCVIPARGGSKRVERKNVRDLRGKPLIAYTIEAGLDSGVVDEVVVSTEDEEIATVAREYGATVPFTRPAELATDTAQVVDVCEHAVDYYESAGEPYDVLVVLLPTTPLRTSWDLRAAYERFGGHEDAEFLMCVTDYSYSPFEALRFRGDWLERFWNRNEYYELRSQDKPDVVVDNGAAYIMDVDAFRREGIFYGERLVGHWMPPERSVDVDEEFDLMLAEFLLERGYGPDE